MRYNYYYIPTRNCCCCSVAHSCPTLCDLVDCSMPGFHIMHYLLEFAQTHILSQWLAISFSVAPLLLLLSIFPRIRVFSNELALHIRWPKYWSFSFSTSPSNSGLISIRIDWFYPPAVQGTLKSLLRTTVWKHQFFGPWPSLWFNSHLCTWLLKKTTALTIWTFVSKMTPQLFKIPPGFVIAFLRRSKCLLISWPQSLSTVILEPKKIKSVTVSIASPTIYHEVMGPDAKILNVEF